MRSMIRYSANMHPLASTAHNNEHTYAFMVNFVGSFQSYVQIDAHDCWLQVG